MNTKPFLTASALALVTMCGGCDSQQEESKKLTPQEVYDAFYRLNINEQKEFGDLVDQKMKDLEEKGVKPYSD